MGILLQKTLDLHLKRHSLGHCVGEEWQGKEKTKIGRFEPNIELEGIRNFVRTMSDFCPTGGIGPQHPLLIIKCDRRE